MSGRDGAVMAMVVVIALGFLVADGERRRVLWVQAMRRCLLRMCDLIRYEQPVLEELLCRIDLRTTPQERELTRLLHMSARRLSHCTNPQLRMIFEREAALSPLYGVLCEEDSGTFEAVLADLGHRGMSEQLRLIDEADERLRAREEFLRRETGRRAQLIRALSLTGGATVFLILI